MGSTRERRSKNTMIEESREGEGSRTLPEVLKDHASRSERTPRSLLEGF